jgi:hypothetical protein
MPSFLIVGNPLTDRLFHGLRDMDHLSLFSDSKGQIKAGMKLASGALAAGLSASPLHGDEAAAEEGLVVKDLGEAGPGATFRVGQMASRAHGGITSFRIYLLYLYISDITGLSSDFSNANLLRVGSAGLNYGIHGGFAKKKNRSAEFL